MIIDKSFSHIDINTRIIVCEENNVRYIANNTKIAIVYKFKIDGEVISNSQQKRCDYLVENETTRNAYFVELKGADIAKAYLQLRETIHAFADCLSDYYIHCRVVCSKIPTHNINGSEYRNLRKICKDIQQKSRQLEEDI